MKRLTLIAALFASTALAACEGGTDGKDQPLPGEQAQNEAKPAPQPGGGSMQRISFSPQDVDKATFSPEAAASNERTPAVLRAQVLLDRARFRPGVIDGVMGENVRQAIAAFEAANGLQVDGQLDQAVFDKLTESDDRPVLIEHTLTAEDVAGPFEQTIPSDLEAQSKLPALSFTSVEEKLGERFHMTPDLLKAMNPDAKFAAGEKIRVADVGVGKLGEVAKIEVDKSEVAVKAYDASGKLIAFYPATIGSETLPTPDGTMTVKAVAPRPDYTYDPKKLNSGKADKLLNIKPGPNNPVGEVWIDLTKETYGIHGTPEPHLIGKRSSSGCVRLTNWDARELSQAVKPGVPVAFVS